MPFHIHAPKPLHGWRAFFGEIAVIVIGVLIALTAEELVTAWTWHHKVAVGEKALAAEQGDNFVYLAENVTVARCVDAQLAQLADRLIQRGRAWKPVPSIEDRGVSGVIRAPWRSMGTGAWAAIVSEGASTHLSRARQQANIQLYTQASEWAPNEVAMRAAIDRLRVLSEPVDLDARSRIDLLQQISSLRGLMQNNALLARQMLVHIDYAGHMPATAYVNEWLAPAHSGTIAYCKRKGLPLDDWQKVLAQGRAEIGPPDTAP